MLDRIRSVFRKGDKGEKGRHAKGKGGQGERDEVRHNPAFARSPSGEATASSSFRFRNSFTRRKSSSARQSSHHDGGYASDSVLSRRSAKHHSKPVVWENAGQANPRYYSSTGEGSSQSSARQGSQHISSSSSGTHSQRSQTTTKLSDSGGAPNLVRMIVNTDFEPCCKGELPIEQGQHVTALFRHNDWLYVRARNGAEGYVPLHHCSRDRRFSQKSTSKSSSGVSGLASTPDMPHSLSSNTIPRSSVSQKSSIASVKSQPSQDVFLPQHPASEERPGDGVFMTSSDASMQQHIGHGRQHKKHGPMNTGRAMPSTGHAMPRRDTQSVATTAHPRRSSQADKFSRSVVSDSEMLHSTSIQRSFEPQLGKQVPNPPRRPDYLCRCVALYDFVESRPTEVTVLRGETAFVMNADNQHWLWICCNDGRKGYIPRSFVVLEDNLTNPKVKGRYRPAAHGSDTELQLALRADHRRRSSSGSLASKPQPSRPPGYNTKPSSHRTDSFRRATSATDLGPLSTGTKISASLISFGECAVDVPQELLNATLAEHRMSTAKKATNRHSASQAMKPSSRAKTASLTSLSRKSSSIMVLWSFAAQRSSQLSVERSEIVSVLSTSTASGDKDWVKVLNHKGITGYIPAACIKPAPKK